MTFRSLLLCASALTGLFCNSCSASPNPSSRCDEYEKMDWELTSFIIQDFPEVNKTGREIVFDFINCDFDLSRHDSKGLTMLHWAALRGWEELLQLLIKNGADVNARSQHGEIPVLISALNGRRPYEIAKTLLQNGANPNDVAVEGTSPLMAASADIRSTTLLIKHGANVNWQNSTLSSPLLNAVSSGALDVAIVLKDAGADLNATYQYNDSLIHAAVDTYCCKPPQKMLVIKWLVENGLNLDFINDAGETPLARALKTHQYDVAEYLIHLGAKCFLPALEDKNPFEIIKDWHPGEKQDFFFDVCGKEK